MNPKNCYITIDNLDLCPACKVGKLRPIGKDSVSGDGDAEGQSTRIMICDNDDCGHRQANVGFTETVPVSDSLEQRKNEDSKS
jgi:hypothetical protein